MTRNLTAKRILWAFIGIAGFYGLTIVVSLVNALKIATEY